MGARALHVLIWFGLAISLAYPSWEEGVIYSFKWFLPAIMGLEGGAVQPLVGERGVGLILIAHGDYYLPSSGGERGDSSLYNHLVWE